MSTEFLHGVRATINQEGYTRKPIVSTTTIGMIVTAPAADEDYFPLNQCVLVLNFEEAIEKAGKGGTLRDALIDIRKETITPIIVVRVEEGNSDEETVANIMGEIGANGLRTGFEALELANVQVGMAPKLFVVPKYDVNEPIRLKLASVAEKHLGFAYISIEDAATVSDALKVSDEFSSPYSMLIYNNALAYDTELKASGERYSVAQIAGLRAKLDQQKGWHHSISNNALAEVSGVTKEVTFAPINGYGTEANELNKANITVLVRDDGAYKVWGNRTSAPKDSSFFFEVYTRTASFIAEEAARLLSAIKQDKPLTPAMLDRFRAEYNEILGAHVRAERLLGGEVILDPNKNDANSMMEGRSDYLLTFTPVPPAESPGVEVKLTADFINAIAI